MASISAGALIGSLECNLVRLDIKLKKIRPNGSMTQRAVEEVISAFCVCDNEANYRRSFVIKPPAVF